MPTNSYTGPRLHVIKCAFADWVTSEWRGGAQRMRRQPTIFDFVRRGRSEILKEIFLKFIFLERNSDILQRFRSNR